MHSQPSVLAGKKVKIKASVKHFQYQNFGGSDFQVEDYWDRIAGKSWMNSDGNPACMVYAMRSGMAKLPIDDEVVYGKVGGMGSLVHLSELETE